MGNTKKTAWEFAWHELSHMYFWPRGLTFKLFVQRAEQHGYRVVPVRIMEDG